MDLPEWDFGRQSVNRKKTSLEQMAKKRPERNCASLAPLMRARCPAPQAPGRRHEHSHNAHD